MFVLKDKVVKITMGFMVTSFLTFAAIMPVSAADFQPKQDNNASIAVQEEDSKAPYVHTSPT